MYVPPGVTSKTGFISKFDKLKSQERPLERPFERPIERVRTFERKPIERQEEPTKPFISKFDVKKSNETKETKLANQYIQNGSIVNSNAKIIKNTTTIIKPNIKPSVFRDHENDPTSRACWFVSYQPKIIPKKEPTKVRSTIVITPISIEKPDIDAGKKSSLLMKCMFNTTLNSKALNVLEKLIMDFNLGEMELNRILSIDDTLTKQQEMDLGNQRRMFIEMEEIISNPKRIEKQGDLEKIKSLSEFKTESEIRHKLKYLLEDYSYNPKEIRRRLNIIHDRIKKLEKLKQTDEIERAKLIEQLKYFYYEEQHNFLSKS